VTQHHNLLIKSLEKLLHEKTFDLSLIESTFIDQVLNIFFPNIFYLRFSKVDLLIDICLKSHVHPRIDYSREELTLRGDYQSILQCFFNLREGKEIYQYSYTLTDNGEKSDEIQFNAFTYVIEN
jgi:hypothetical protein